MTSTLVTYSVTRMSVVHRHGAERELARRAARCARGRAPRRCPRAATASWRAGRAPSAQSLRTRMTSTSRGRRRSSPSCRVASMPGPEPDRARTGAHDRLGEQRSRDQRDDDGDRADAERGRGHARRSCGLALGRLLARARLGAHQEQDGGGEQHERHDVDLAGHGDRRDERDGDQSDGGQERHPRGEHDVVDDDRRAAPCRRRSASRARALGVQRRRPEGDLLAGAARAGPAARGPSRASGSPTAAPCRGGTRAS